MVDNVNGRLRNKMTKQNEIEIDKKPITRDDLLAITTNAIRMIQHKALNGRFKDIKKENIRIQYWKTLNGFIKTSASLMMDKDIELLYKEIDNLKLTSNNTINAGSIADMENKIDTINEIETRLKELNKQKGME